MSDSNYDQVDAEGLGASPDPVALAGRWGRESHPLFPRDDGSPEDRDIQLVTFRRRRTGDRLVQNYPEDIPAHEVQSWAQVVGWWGGGEYKALGKNAKHELVAVHPAGTDGWECFDGDSKPFTFRDGSPYAEHHAAPTRAAEASAATPSVAPAPASAASNGLEAHVADLVREMRASRAAPPAGATPPAAPSNDNTVLIALINAQAQANRDFQAQMQAAAARESENLRVMMTAMLSQRSVEAKPAAEPTTVALSLLKAIRDFTQSAPQSSMAETISQFKVLKELTTPAAPVAPAAGMSEIGEIVSGITTLIQVETSKAATEQARPAPPERRPPPPPPRYLVNVPGLGLVDVVRPEPPMSPPASLPMGTENRLDIDAIKRDPALRARVLAELESGVPAMATAPAHVAARVPSTTPIAASVAAPTAAPTAPVAVGPQPVASSPSPLAAEPAHADLPNAPPDPPSAVAPPPSAPTAPTTSAPAGAPPVSIAPAPATTVAPPMPVATVPEPTAPSASATSDDKRALIAEPTQTAMRGSLAVTDDERLRAVYALRTIARMPPDQRRAELSKLPGLDGGIDMLVQALENLDSVSPDAWARFTAALPADAVRVLVHGPGG